MKRTDFVKIGEVVKAYAARDEMREGRANARVVEEVKALMGEELMGYVNELDFDKESGTLTIGVRSAALRTNLMMERDRIMESVKAVKKIRLR